MIGALPWIRSPRIRECDYCGNAAQWVPGRGEVCAACLDSIVDLESVMGMTSIMEDDHAENLSPNPVDGM